jgi:predicted DNA binding CopG/RHH family protein
MDKESQEDFINELLKSHLSITKRKTQGHDHSKNYHKITISVSEKDKEAIAAYAKKHRIKVSALIREALLEKGVID